MVESYNILHIDTERTWRGGEAQVFSLCHGLSGMGFRQVAAIQPGAPLGQSLRDIGIETVELPMRGELHLRAAFQLSEICRKKNIHLAHTHDAHAHALGWLATMRPPRIPVVVTRRVDFPVGGNLFSLLKYKSKRVFFIAISHGVKKVLMEGGVPEERIEVVHSGVDPGRFLGKCDGTAFKRKYGIGKDQIVIGNVAALSDHKGHVYLIDAVPRVLQKFPNARFFIIGQGELLPLLEARIEKLGLKGKVTLTGYIKEVEEAFRAMDLFVLSSHLEGLCTSVLDAMLMRVPVVATRTGGIPDVVEDGANGYLVEPKNPESLAQGIIRLLEDRKAQERFVNTGYERVIKHFTKEKMVSGTAAVYHKILGKSE
jgi:glycosyltransferase involved in cell wall biosynthesis